MDDNRITEFFKDKQGIDVRIYNSHMNRYEVSIVVGSVKTLTLENVDTLIREALLRYAPIKDEYARVSSQKKEIEDYKTFFRLLRGEK